MQGLTSFFWHGDTLRSRGVSHVVLSGTVDLPAVSARLLAEWDSEITHRLSLEPGVVEALPLARSRVRGRWPDYPRYVEAVVDWTHRMGLPDVLASSDIALMACRGARYHHDAAQYGDAAFCNLFLTEDKALDLHFPMADLRIPLVRGTIVVFDTGQPHAVIPRGSSDFNGVDFPLGQDDSQVFLTWELAIENSHVSRALQVAFDTDSIAAARLTEPQVLLNGVPISVCTASGRWCTAQ